MKNCHSLKDLYFWAYFKMPYLFPVARFPIFLDIELTNSCNLNCIHCLSQRNEMKRDIGFMSYDVFEKIANEFMQYKNRHLLICGVGEPVLHPNIKEILDYLTKMKIRHSFYTNGAFMKRFSINKIMDWDIDTIVVSVDGLDAESHKKIRIGSEYNIIKENVSNLFRLRKEQRKANPRIEIRHVIFPNEDNNQLVNFREEWLKIADAVKFNFLISPLDKCYRQDKNLRRCRDIRRKMHVRWNGQVPVCGYQYIHDDYECLGDIQNSSIKEMWNHPRLKELRYFHRKRIFDSISFCTRCVFTQT